MTRPVLSAEQDGWPALMRDVKLRDGACVFARRPDHVCRGRDRHVIDWSREYVLEADIELDHVKEEPMAAKKAPHDSAHLATVCWSAHHQGLATSHEGREFERGHLATLYPEVWAVWLERQAIA